LSAKSQPCKTSREYARRDPNPIAMKLLEILPRVFCDLHDPQQMHQLEKSSGMTADALSDGLFVTERCQPDDWPLTAWDLNRAYPDFRPGSEMLRLNANGIAWASVPVPPEIARHNQSATDNELATLLLAGNHKRLAVLVGRVGCGKTSLITRFLTKVRHQFPELGNYVFLKMDFARPDVQHAWAERTRGVSRLDAVFDVVLSAYYLERFGKEQPTLPVLFAHSYALNAKQVEFADYTEPVRQRKARQWYAKRKANASTWNDTRMHYLQDDLGHPVVIIVDNVDRWELADQIALGRNLMHEGKTYGAGLLLILRHNAYTEFQKEVPQSQNRQEVVYLTPPRLDQVIERRLGLLARIGRETDELHARGLIGTEGALFANTEEFDQFLVGTTRSITTGEAGEFVKNFCNHNVRRMLDFVLKYLSSQQAPLVQMIPSQTGGSRGHHVSLQKVVAVAALEDGTFYRPDVSTLCNLFCNGSGTAHCDALIRLRVLTFAYRGDRTPQSRIWHGLTAVGYDPGQVREAIRGLDDAGLIESRQRLSNPEAILFATAAGKYYLDTLTQTISYYQYTRDGSFLPDFQKPTGNHKSREIRLLGAAQFLQFLDLEEQIEERRGLQEPSIYHTVCGSGTTIAVLVRDHLLAQLRSLAIEGGEGAHTTREEALRILRAVAYRVNGGRVG
jgi:hypothetical protein